jgi:hypothetical protein
MKQFIFNFKKMEVGNTVKILKEMKEQFENILEENDWYENEVLCYEPKFSTLDENKLSYKSTNLIPLLVAI